METLKKLSLVLSAAILAMALAMGPAFAAETGGGEGGGGESGGAEKIQLPERQHDLVGLLLIGALGAGALAALVNARKQLRGERDQASGEFRWR